VRVGHHPQEGIQILARGCVPGDELVGHHDVLHHGEGHGPLQASSGV